SREQLGLRGEWVVEVGGLELPGPELPAAQSSAVQLFAHSARRISPDFELGPETLEDVVRVCRMTGAMPLGIELAAAWLPTLSCAEIAVEIERSLDFLATGPRDAPERHRSIRVVFDRSWEWLTDDEQRVFSRLAVFHGGASRAAAEAIAGGSLPVLSALVAKSLVRRVASGRFEVHELLRQYAAARLAERPAEAEETRDRHCAWFCDMLAHKRAELSGTGQQRALEEIGSDHENVRAAWAWAVERRRIADILKAVHGYWLYAEVTGRYLETQEILGQVIAMLSSEPEGVVAGRRERELALGAALIRYGSIHERLGDYAAGERAIDAGMAVPRSLDEPFNLGLALNFKAMFARAREEYGQERALLLRSIDHFIAAGDRWGRGYSLNDLGMATLMLGDPGEARRLQRQALEIFDEIGDRRGAAFALHNLGVVALATGDLDEAREHLRESLAIRRDLRHSWGIATTLTALVSVERAAGRAGDARDLLREALVGAVAVQSITAALGAALEMAALWMSGDADERGRAARTLALARSHPALDAAARARAASLLAELGATTPEPLLRPDWVTQPVAEQVRVMLGGEAELALA
ncbi:MAG TPA: tetratricopeptide repeat protein, partial [Thermomicrobiales bacterium]|nr:tetratricopeptide repeat protein [Thermomicrobiales bacterium]